MPRQSTFKPLNCQVWQMQALTQGILVETKLDESSEIGPIYLFT